MAKPAPTCRKCHKDHFNFVPCAKAEAFAENSQALEQKCTPHILRVQREDGLKDWGDRLTTLTRLGGNTFGAAERTVPMQTGSITGPPEWTPPEAA